jgi:hypothetical protein
VGLGPEALRRGKASLPDTSVRRRGEASHQPELGGHPKGAHESATGTFADNGIVSEMLNGVSDDVESPRGSLLCAPHLGALRFFSEADSRLRTNLTEGWAAVHEDVPFWPIRCDPYSVVDESERAGKPKFRLTNDHSWPPPGLVSADGTLRVRGIMWRRSTTR